MHGLLRLRILYSVPSSFFLSFSSFWFLCALLIVRLRVSSWYPLHEALLPLLWCLFLLCRCYSCRAYRRRFPSLMFRRHQGEASSSTQ